MNMYISFSRTLKEQKAAQTQKGKELKHLEPSSKHGWENFEEDQMQCPQLISRETNPI